MIGKQRIRPKRQGRRLHQIKENTTSVLSKNTFQYNYLAFYQIHENDNATFQCGYIRGIHGIGRELESEADLFPESNEISWTFMQLWLSCYWLSRSKLDGIFREACRPYDWYSLTAIRSLLSEHPKTFHGFFCSFHNRQFSCFHI